MAPLMTSTHLQCSTRNSMSSLQTSRLSTTSLQCGSTPRPSTSSLQVSLKNTFLSFIESPRPSLRKAITSTSMFDSEFVNVDLDFLDSPTTYQSGESDVEYSLSTISPRDLGIEKQDSKSSKCLENYVASVGHCPKTTVMVRGIPKNYDQEMLLAEVKAEGLPVNFLYLPPGKTKSNRSYGFVNFETEHAAAQFLYNFEGHQWRQRGASKSANVGYATLQGYEPNIAFFSKQEVAKGVSKRSPWIKH